MLFVEQTSREINYFARKQWRRFLFLETSYHVLGYEIDQVSPMFISEHANTCEAKQMYADFVLQQPK